MDIAGQKFDRLTPIELWGEDKHGRKTWLCVCDCGNLKEILGMHIKAGKIRSCGCLAKELAFEKGKIIGAKTPKGSKSHLWKPELTDEDRQSRREITKSKHWRGDVFKVFSYRCDVCGKNGKLNAHHLENWADNPDLRFDIANGVALCVEHHKDFHMSLGGMRVPCTKRDYIEWKRLIGEVRDGSD